MEVRMHLPLSDEGCLGKFAWCGTGKPFNYTFLHTKPVSTVWDKDSRIFSCLVFIWFKKQSMNIYREYCENVVKPARRKVICEIPLS